MNAFSIDLWQCHDSGKMHKTTIVVSLKNIHTAI